MKKIVRIMAVALVASIAAFTTSVSTIQAQDQDVMKQAMEGYQKISSMTASVKKTTHNTMVTKDQVSTGTFYFKKPAKMCVSTNGGKDKLVTDGEKFTIVQDGKASTATGGSSSSLGPLTTAIKNITSGNADTDLSDVADVDMERDATSMTMTITPITANAAERRKLVYQSFVIVIDTKAGELRSVRLNGKSGNYELYEFSNYKMDVPVNDSVFEVK
ncbi:MAG: outer membrane lipoprotein carrier protein LolA [Bacteroidales bacterium]|nr:outer membrane lipoprotein carrier protein LolA [Bacteroidales bacterium]